MTSTQGKLRSLILTALMVTSVFAGTVMLSGAAVAQAGNTTRGDAGTYYIDNSTGDVGYNGTVFQGEEDITFVDDSLNEISPAKFQQSGDGSQVLSMPVPTDQQTGVYTDGTSTLTVQTPRITTLEITNQNGDDVAGGAVNIGDSTELTLDVEYNFEQAESLDVTIEDSNGLEVTDSVLAESPPVGGDGVVDLALTEANLDNEEYTITVEGTDDLDFGEASQSTTLDVTSGDEVAIDVQADQVTRGEDVTFEVDQGAEGDTHLVAVEGGDIQGNASNIFRNVGDTLYTGVQNGSALALVEIDDGVGVGSIDTSELDTTDVTVNVYDAAFVSTSDVETAANLSAATDNLGPVTPADDDNFEVVEGTVTLDNPRGAYVVGSETTINGSTSAGVDDVALYVRGEGAYEYLTSVSVDGDDTFEEEDVVLSDNGGDVESDLLTLPGTYRIAAVDADDEALARDSSEGYVANLDFTQNTSAISGAVGEQYSLRVTDTGLTVDYVSIINGQVAEGDTLRLNGTAPGKDEVSVSFYGPRGSYDTTGVSVDSDGTYDADNVGIGGHLPNSDISQGNVVMSVFSSGRDGTVGDGEFPGHSSKGTWAASLNDRSLTQDQLINVVSSETVDDTGSDDLSEVFQFRYTDGTVGIDSVTSPGADEPFLVSSNSTMTVSGTTNQQPDDNSITVEVIDGPSSSELSIESTDMWGTDGQWSVDISTEGAEPGNYTVEASVDGNSDVRSFQVTDEEFEPEEPEEPTTPDTDTPDTDTPDTDTPDTDTPDTDTPDQDTETEEPTTTAGGPGFTAVLALVALVAAALLAVRRRD